MMNGETSGRKGGDIGGQSREWQCRVGRRFAWCGLEQSGRDTVAHFCSVGLEGERKSKLVVFGVYKGGHTLKASCEA